MTRARVVVIGGGLAGLCAARLLQAAGVGFELLEAGGRLGGRILSADERGAPAADGFDLGASWFWPRVQPEFGALVAGLNLEIFPQNFEGDIVVERMSRETPQRYRPLQQEPQSMRLVGGTGALVAALARALPAGSLGLGRRVTRLTLGERGVDLSVETAEGMMQDLSAEVVIAAVPPRLLAESIAFAPPCDATVTGRWRATDTWMAPHAKFVALYNRPFWREAGLSGTAQSFVGPMAEIHDATTASGRAALLGFLAVGAENRASLGEVALAEACLAQFVRLFGPEAGRPRQTLVKDWAREPLTATRDDRSAGAHPTAAAGAWVDDRWIGRLVLAGSETSAFEPGFMAGAVAAAAQAVAEVLRRLGPNPASARL